MSGHFSKARRSISALLSLIMCAVMIIFTMPAVTFADMQKEDIVIIYENDVHCEIDGYSKLSALRKTLEAEHEYVGVVSSGDYIQGNSIGTISRGKYTVELMNLVGYDAVALGNHEFDYKLDRLNELVDMLDAQAVCCNFLEIGSAEPYFDPYTIISYGETDIAFIGITTPITLVSSSSGQFKNEQGDYLYTFNSTNLSDTVQRYVDRAIAEGADYVIALSHLGDAEPAYNIDDVIPGVCGIDAVLDAHSHSVIESRILKDKNGCDVVVSSTGTKFEYIGVLTISDGEITTELVKTEELEATDPVIDERLAEIYAEHSAAGDKVIAHSEVDLVTHDADGNRIIRQQHTNLGNFCSDAFRIVLGADIGYMNGGGIRAEIKAGEVTLNDLFDVFPYNNTPVMIQTTGAAIRDMLELTTSDWPDERGSFPQVSGIIFSLDTSIESSAVFDDNEMFARVDGEYRVYNIQVLDRESGEYKPLDLQKTYTVAGTNHSLLEGGGGISVYKDAEILVNNGDLDVELIEAYITEHLGGVIDSRYAEARSGITYTDGKITDETDADSPVIIIVCVVVVAVLAAIIAALILIKRKNTLKQA